MATCVINGYLHHCHFPLNFRLLICIPQSRALRLQLITIWLAMDWIVPLVVLGLLLAQVRLWNTDVSFLIAVDRIVSLLVLLHIIRVYSPYLCYHQIVFLKLFKHSLLLLACLLYIFDADSLSLGDVEIHFFYFICYISSACVQDEDLMELSKLYTLLLFVFCEHHIKVFCFCKCRPDHSWY